MSRGIKTLAQQSKKKFFEAILHTLLYNVRDTLGEEDDTVEIMDIFYDVAREIFIRDHIHPSSRYTSFQNSIYTACHDAEVYIQYQFNKKADPIIQSLIPRGSASGFP